MNFWRSTVVLRFPSTGFVYFSKWSMKTDSRTKENYFILAVFSTHMYINICFLFMIAFQYSKLCFPISIFSLHNCFVFLQFVALRLLTVIAEGKLIYVPSWNQLGTGYTKKTLTNSNKKEMKQIRQNIFFLIKQKTFSP